MSNGHPSAPAWLVDRPVAPCACCGVSRARHRHLERTAARVASAVRHDLLSDSLAREDGFLQRLDVRGKLVVAIAALLVVSVTSTITTLLIVYAVVTLVAVRSRVPFRTFTARIWLFVPVFTGLIALPITTNLVTPGAPLLHLGHWFGHDLSITDAGLAHAARLVLRVATSIAVVTALVLTTPWNRLLAAARWIRVPKMFVMVTALTLRYVHHLADVTIEMIDARRARGAGLLRRPGEGRAVVASTVGSVFVRSMQVADEVHDAMLSRGYRGDPPRTAPFELTRNDVVFLMESIGAIALIAAVGGWIHG